jgi:hypothetical protein
MALTEGALLAISKVEKRGGFPPSLNSTAWIMKMKKLLIAVAVIVVPSMVQAANTLRSYEILGEWCVEPGELKLPKNITLYYPCKDAGFEEKNDSWITFKTKSVEGHEFGCKYLSVKEHTKTDRYGDKTDVAEIVGDCCGEACHWKDSFSISVGPSGIMDVRQTQIAKTRCGG